jgi:hypothetical protein
MINWICQSNLCDMTGLEQIKEVCEESGGRYVPYTVIPFESNTSGFPAVGTNVFYGSVTWINKLSEEKRAGVFFDKDKFTCLYWGEKYRDLLVNDDFKVLTLKEFATSKEYNNITSLINREIFFVRPAADNKAFDGHIYQSFQVLDSIGGDPDYLSSLPIIIASPKCIHLEYRLFFVNGKVSSACQYKQRGSLSVNKTIPPDLIPWAEDHLKDFHDVFVADVAIVEGRKGFSGYRLLEFGCVNAAGFYGVDVKKIVKDINEYLENKEK